MKRNYAEIKEETLARLNLHEEYAKFGAVFEGSISTTGWQPVHNLYKKDVHASCGIYMGQGKARGMLVMHNDIVDGKVQKGRGFFDVAADFLPGTEGDWKKALWHYAKQTNVHMDSHKPPTQEMLEKYKKDLIAGVREYLKNKRGLNEASIEKYQLGWDIRKERNVFPVFDKDGELVNFRYHNSKKKPKTLNYTGYGDARLWGVNRTVLLPDGSIIAITEGEWDSMLVEQETGLTCVSPTNGCKAFLAEWVEHFHGHHVVLLFDCDQEGRKAVQRLILPSFRQAILDGKVLSIKIIWLYEEASKDEKDFTDYIVKSGGTGQEILNKIEATEPYTYPQPTTDLPEAIPIKSFAEVDNAQHVGKRVTTPIFVFGENSEAYHAPSELNVAFCSLLDKDKCHGREDWDWLCDNPIQIPNGNRIQLSAIRASDSQMQGALRDYVCDKAKRPHVISTEDKKITLREVYAHQVLTSDAETAEMVEKPVYVMGGGLVPIGQYQATGFIHTLPRDQRPSMLIDTIEPQEQDWQGFDLDKSRPQLRILQDIDITDMVEDMSLSVTRIYERTELHLATLLCMCSPRWIFMPGEGEIRGWVNCIVIGDTGEGKTAVSEKSFKHAGVGSRVSGMTTTRTGITYACEFIEKRGWRVKAGALLKMNKQALLVDEAQDLKEADLKTMAEALDVGRLKIARIDTRTFEAETRCLFSCNPIDPRRRSQQRTMDSFRYGCQSLIDIYPRMMLRRTDLALFCAAFDIKDKSLVNRSMQLRYPRWMSKENFRTLVFYAWNLTVGQISISDDVANRVRSVAQEMSDKFGQCDDLPLVHPQDFRKTLCRLATALAVLDLSSDDDFSTITVLEKHVDYMRDFIDQIYSADNCQLDEYSNQYAVTHRLADNEAENIIHEIDCYCDSSQDRKKRLRVIVRELNQLDLYNEEKITQGFLSKILETHRTTISEDLQLFIRANLATSSRGYKPTVKFLWFVKYLKQKNLLENYMSGYVG